MSKSSAGNFFEDFKLGQRICHPTPRTVHGGDLAHYIAITGDRRPLHSSTEYARSLGFQREVVHDLLTFHIIFGKSVNDISLNAVANLGYAEVRFLKTVYPGDTLTATSEIIGLRETSTGKAGVVYVRTSGTNQRDQEVLRYHRWVLVNKRDPSVGTGINEVPQLATTMSADALPSRPELQLTRYDDLQWASGGRAYWEDYRVGEEIDHIDGMTIEEADHMQLTRMTQNSAKVHFNEHKMAASRFGKRLVYGGYIISLAHALSFNGLENGLVIAGWNSGVHANPSFAGDTIYARTQVLATEAVSGGDGRLGALRLRLLAYKNVDPSHSEVPILSSDGKYNANVVLDLDYWVVMPRRIAAT